MAPFPLPIDSLLGHWPSYVVYIAIGFGFGYVLEIAGFGKSTKLAAQFYLKEMTVLKVMFTAIVVAAVLIFLASAVGLLDYNLVWVNPTYLWPGIVGGLVMGVGFILGGFCPGTSIVAASTLKIDGIVFLLGAFFGIFAFGETVGLFEDFWYSSYMGRFTLQQLFNVDAGVIVLAVVLMALAAFVFAEYSERTFGKGLVKKAPRWSLSAAGGLVVLAGVTLFIGQPTNADRQAALAIDQETALTERSVQIHPAELLAYLNNRQIIPYVIDVRSESDFNAFHLPGAHRVPLDGILPLAQDLQLQPRNTLFVVLSNEEAAATDAWRMLNAEGIANVYILEGGINKWLDTFSDEAFQAAYKLEPAGLDQLAYALPGALGSRYDAADPNPAAFTIEYTPKVKLSVGRGATGGGCG